MRLLATTTTDAMPTVLSDEEIAKWLRVEEGDTVVASLVKAAMFWAEGWCDQPLFERTYTATVRNFQHYGYLPGVKLSELAITYDTASLSDQVLDPAGYSLSDRGYLVFAPGSVSGLLPTRITLSYKAGYPAGTVPEDIKLALLLTTGNLYDNRNNPVSEKRTAAENLLQPYKLYSC